MRQSNDAAGGNESSGRVECAECVWGTRGRKSEGIPVPLVTRKKQSVSITLGITQCMTRFSLVKTIGNMQLDR